MWSLTHLFPFLFLFLSPHSSYSSFPAKNKFHVITFFIFFSSSFGYSCRMPPFFYFISSSSSSFPVHSNAWALPCYLLLLLLHQFAIINPLSSLPTSIVAITPSLLINLGIKGKQSTSPQQLQDQFQDFNSKLMERIKRRGSKLAI